jgi:uncharacterized protein YdaT
MPWSMTNAPPAMRSLPVSVREKAIHIANALLLEGESEGRAIRIGIAQAQRWALRRRSLQAGAGWMRR